MDLYLSDICISTIFLLSILYIFGLIKCYSKLPPGPFGLPILGYLPFINPVKPHETISELVTKYGKIFSMQMGQILCIVLADPEIIRTVFSKSKFQLYYKWYFSEQQSSDILSRPKKLKKIYFLNLLNNVK